MGNTDAVPAPTLMTHPRGFFFLFAGEFAERFSFYGMRAILPLYMADQMGFGEARGGAFYYYFLSACYFLPLLGGYIADNYFGKYWTIVGFSVPYIMGHLILGIEDPYVMTAALALLAMGTGVIKPNISTLLGLTYDQQRPGLEKLRSHAFQYFYMSINIGAFLAQVIVPVVRDQTGSYALAFAVPAVFMFIALGFFAAGKRFYAVEVIDRARPPESPEQVVAKLRVLGQVALLFALVSFFWAVFDQSSSAWVFFAKTYMDLDILGYPLAPDSIQALNPFFIVVIIAGTALYRTFVAKPAGTARAGVAPTTKMLIGFLLTAGCMGVMAGAGYLTGQPEKALQVKSEEVEVFVPLGTVDLSPGTIDFTTEKVTVANTGGRVALPGGGGAGLTFQKYTAAGGDKVTFKDGELVLADGRKLVFTGGSLDYEKSRAVFSDGKLDLPGAYEHTFRQGKYQLPDGVLVVTRGNQAAIHSGDRLAFPTPKGDDPAVTVGTGKYVKPENRVSVWWMALAFLVITVAEILISVTGLELAFVVAPDNMKGFITACWLSTVTVANLFINAPIADLYPAMHPGNYFAMLAGIGLLVAVLFVPVSRQFNRAMAAAAEKEREASLEANSEVV